MIDIYIGYSVQYSKKYIIISKEKKSDNSYHTHTAISILILANSTGPLTIGDISRKSPRERLKTHHFKNTEQLRKQYYTVF